MSENTRPTWLTEQIAASADHVKPGTCPHCHSPVIRARAGRIAALDVIADPQPITAAEEILARIDGLLTWRLITTALGDQRILWRNPGFVPHAKHPVIADHRCPSHPVQGTLL
jgi:hypothetical protein